MAADISKKQESRIDEKLISKSRRGPRDDGFKRGKVVNEVLDKPTVMTLYKMIKNRVVSYVNGAVSAGKESLLFWAVDEGGSDVALKVYLVSTANFKRRESYMAGDPRFSRLRGGTRNLVYAWARKEFHNLSRCRDAGIAVPVPIAQSNNVLAMSFVGRDGRPARRLLESEAGRDDYLQAVSILKRLYAGARLAHGDFSEFNIFKTRQGLVVFDLGAAVDLGHPRALEFLRRDVENITRFFSKRGIPVDDPSEVFGNIVK